MACTEDMVLRTISSSVLRTCNWPVRGETFRYKFVINTRTVINDIMKLFTFRHHIRHRRHLYHHNYHRNHHHHVVSLNRTSFSRRGRSTLFFSVLDQISVFGPLNSISPSRRVRSIRLFWLSFGFHSSWWLPFENRLFNHIILYFCCKTREMIQNVQS